MSEPDRESTPPPGDSSEPRSKERPEASGGNGFSDDKTVSEAQPPAEESDTVSDGTPPKPSDETGGKAADAKTQVDASKADEEPAKPASTTPAADTEPVIEIKYFGRTHVGLVREHNEDNFLVADLVHAVRGLDHIDAKATHADLTVGARGAVFAVCDGMGGAAAGEVASQMAVDTVWEYFSHLKEPRDRDHFARRLVSSIEEAGNRIFSAAKMDRTRRGMGTTATVAGLIDKVLFVGQVGDSRAYILRQGKLVQITKDQSLVNQLIEAGQLTEDEAEAFDHSNIILQALGTTEEVTVDLTFLELRKGDRLMMCSDGLSGLVHKDMVREVLASTPSLSDCTARLIEMANLGGGHDNITVVCAEFDGSALAAPSVEDEVVYQQYPLPDGLPDDHESLPPREPRIKEGAQKPGADVKRDGTPAEDAPPPRVERAQPESKSSRVFLVFGVLLLIALVVIVVYALASHRDEGVVDEPDRPAIASSPPIRSPSLRRGFACRCAPTRRASCGSTASFTGRSSPSHRWASSSSPARTGSSSGATARPSIKSRWRSARARCRRSSSRCRPVAKTWRRRERRWSSQGDRRAWTSLRPPWTSR
jgi:serine/threonine protein phosphatase PrpC